MRAYNIVLTLFFLASLFAPSFQARAEPKPLEVTTPGPLPKTLGTFNGHSFDKVTFVHRYNDNVPVTNKETGDKRVLIGSTYEGGDYRIRKYYDPQYPEWTPYEVWTGIRNGPIVKLANGHQAKPGEPITWEALPEKKKNSKAGS